MRVEFITTEDEEALIVAFAISPSARRNLILLRSPQYEFMLPIEERGVGVSLYPGEEEDDMLESVQWNKTRVKVKTRLHKYVLDVSAVAPEQIAQAKAVLLKMTKDGAACVESD